MEELKLIKELNKLSETKATGRFNIKDPVKNFGIEHHYRMLSTGATGLGGIGYKQDVVGMKLTEEKGMYLFGINVNGIVVAFCKFSLIKIHGQGYIDIILVHSRINQIKYVRHSASLEKKSLMMVLVDFIKNRFNHPFIETNGLQSNDAIRLIKILSKKYKTKWVNIKTGEIINYDPTRDNINKGEVNEPYRSKNNKTDWRIIIESSGDIGIDEYLLECHYEILNMLRL